MLASPILIGNSLRGDGLRFSCVDGCGAGTIFFRHQHHIQEMVESGYINNDIVTDLAKRGLQTTEDSQVTSAILGHSVSKWLHWCAYREVDDTCLQGC